MIYALPQDRDLVVEVRKRVDRRPVHVTVHSQQRDLLRRQDGQRLIEEPRGDHDLVVKHAVALKRRNDRVRPANVEVLEGPPVRIDAYANQSVNRVRSRRWRGGRDSAMAETRASTI